MFHVNQKAIGAEIDFHHPHALQAFYRMRNVKSSKKTTYTMACTDQR